MGSTAADLGIAAAWAGRGCRWLFLLSRESPEAGQGLLLVQGQKQALERNGLCPFKAMQRLGQAGSGWKGGIWHAGEPSLQGLQKRDFPAAAITPQTQLRAPLGPRCTPLPAPSTASSVWSRAETLCASGSCSGARAGPGHQRGPASGSPPPCPSCQNQADTDFPFLLPVKTLSHREELLFSRYCKVLRCRCACQQQVRSASASLIAPFDSPPRAAVFSVHLPDRLPGRAVLLRGAGDPERGDLWICDPETGLQLPEVRERTRSWLLGAGTRCNVARS